MKSKPILLGLLASLLPVSTLADDASLADRLAGCAKENNDAARLACYDAIARGSAAAEAAPVAEAEYAPASVAAAPVVAAEAATEDTTLTVDRLDQFGRIEENKDALQEITAVATEVFERPAGQLKVTLDNGQVWTEKDHENHFRVRPGDTVTIKKGRLGGYRMVTSSRRSSSVTRLK